MNEMNENENKNIFDKLINNLENNLNICFKFFIY